MQTQPTGHAPGLNTPFDNAALTLLIARFALKGHTVHKGHAGDFTACKFGLSRYCKDFADLQAFARLVGVKS